MIRVISTGLADKELRKHNPTKMLKNQRKYHFKGTYVALLIILKESLKKLCVMRGTGLDRLKILITAILNKVLMRDFRHPPVCKRDHRSARMLRSVDW